MGVFEAHFLTKHFSYKKCVFLLESGAGDAAMINQDHAKFRFFVDRNKASNNKDNWFQIWECVIYWTWKKD